MSFATTIGRLADNGAHIHPHGGSATRELAEIRLAIVPETGFYDKSMINITNLYYPHIILASLLHRYSRFIHVLVVHSLAHLTR